MFQQFVRERLFRQATQEVFLALLKHQLCRMTWARLAEQITKVKLWSLLLPKAKQISRPTPRSLARHVSGSSMASAGEESPALLPAGLSSSLGLCREAGAPATKFGNGWRATPNRWGQLKYQEKQVSLAQVELLSHECKRLPFWESPHIAFRWIHFHCEHRNTQ